MPLPREVFLSHSSLDRQFADDLAEMMRRHGVPVWYSQTNIMGAQQWQAEIGNALRRCDWLVVILSPQSVNSRWVKSEVAYALTLPLRDRIVPVLYREADLGDLWPLSVFQRIDFTGSFEAGSVDLLRTWGLGYTPQP